MKFLIYTVAGRDFWTTFTIPKNVITNIKKKKYIIVKPIHTPLNLIDLKIFSLNRIQI